MQNNCSRGDKVCPNAERGSDVGPDFLNSCGVATISANLGKVVTTGQAFRGLDRFHKFLTHWERHGPEGPPLGWAAGLLESRRAGAGLASPTEVAFCSLFRFVGRTPRPFGIKLGNGIQTSTVLTLPPRLGRCRQIAPIPFFSRGLEGFRSAHEILPFWILKWADIPPFC